MEGIFQGALCLAAFHPNLAQELGSWIRQALARKHNAGRSLFLARMFEDKPGRTDVAVRWLLVAEAQLIGTIQLRFEDPIDPPQR